MQCITPRGKIIPTCSARGAWIGCDYRYARLDEVRPVENLFRIAFAHQKYDGRCVRRAVVRKTGLPVRSQALAFALNRVDVIRERQRYDVRLQTIDHGSCLTRRTAVRLSDGDVLTGALLPLR